MFLANHHNSLLSISNYYCHFHISNLNSCFHYQGASVGGWAVLGPLTANWFSAARRHPAHDPALHTPLHHSITLDTCHAMRAHISILHLPSYEHT